MSRYFDDSLHHIDDNSDYLAHYGRKGMKWGKNIFDDVKTTAINAYRDARDTVTGKGYYKDLRKVYNVNSASEMGRYKKVNRKRNPYIDYDAEQKAAKKRADENSRESMMRNARTRREDPRSDYFNDTAKQEMYKDRSANIRKQAERSKRNAEEKQKRLNEMWKDLDNIKGRKELEKYLKSLSESDRAMLLGVLKRHADSKGE